MAIRNIKVKYDTVTQMLTFKASNGDDLTVAITTAIAGAITAALAPEGAIKAAIDAAITAHAG